MAVVIKMRMQKVWPHFCFVLFSWFWQTISTKSEETDMNHIRTIITFIALTLATGFASAQSWSGHYGYTGNYGKTAGGTPIVLIYDLNINASDKPSCTLKASGFQTDESIVCTIEEDANAQKISILFKSYDGGAELNIYGTAMYKPGEALLELSRKNVKKKSRVITTWKSFHNAEDKAPKPGVYFVKMKK
jgi:hypothetical protein